jgi:hypothetical protein
MSQRKVYERVGVLMGGELKVMMGIHGSIMLKLMSRTISVPRTIEEAA